MDHPSRTSAGLFDVYLRLRPNHVASAQRFLDVEDEGAEHATHITIQPPVNDVRKRAIEKFGFTRVFPEQSTQLDIFNGTNILPLIEGVLAPSRRVGRDGLIATLGVTGSGKSHTILGSKTQRGLTQMVLSVLYRSIASNVKDSSIIQHEIAASDVSEGQIMAASSFFDSIYSENDQSSRTGSRAQTPTPMLVSNHVPASSLSLYKSLLGHLHPNQNHENHRDVTHTPSSKHHPPMVSFLPQEPSMDHVQVAIDRSCDYAILISMYEVYNDKIFDLLTGTATNSKTPAKDSKRRPLLFKGTEYSPDRKVVAGLRKVLCDNLDEALSVLETALTERRVAGTGSNAVSSRSHGFFNIEIKKRPRDVMANWSSSTLTIVDLAGSERARAAKTAGTTLAEAGKINESLMYLGQCMQMQSDNAAILSTAAADTSFASTSNNISSTKPGLVPFRQCKLTELLFANIFHERAAPRTTTSQKAVMIVTADPCGDFNATSQILKYSALAREVTVPRIPSTTSTILSNADAGPARTHQSLASDLMSGRNTPVASSADLHSLLEELSLLRLQADEETQRRIAAEAALDAAHARLETLEADVRADCWAAFELQLAAEKSTLQTALTEQAARADAHVDAKIAIFSKGVVEICEDDAESKLAVLERENELLMEKVKMLTRQRDGARSPSRKLKVLKGRAWGDEEDDENIVY